MVFRVRVEGDGYVPSKGSAIIAFNHVSVIDGPAVGIVVARRSRRRSRFLVAAEVFDNHLPGWILRSFDQIPIRRGQGDVNALDEAIHTVKAGAIAALAPEGRVNEDGATEMLRFHRGVARLALATGAPVVPVGIWGTQSRWPRSGRRYGKPWRPRLAFVFGEVVTPLGDPGDADDLAAFTQLVREAIEVQVARARVLTEVG
jgi:putative phosphoserine phosphatase/1-acylglycerol-3-phosphate O-acyltransferase